MSKLSFSLGLILLAVNVIAAFHKGRIIASINATKRGRIHATKCELSCLQMCLPSCKFECCQKKFFNAKLEEEEHELDQQELQQLSQIARGVGIIVKKDQTPKHETKGSKTKTQMKNFKTKQSKNALHLDHIIIKKGNTTKQLGSHRPIMPFKSPKRPINDLKDSHPKSKHSPKSKNMSKTHSKEKTTKLSPNSVVNTIERLQDEIGAFDKDDSHLVLLPNDSDNDQTISDSSVSKWTPVTFDGEKNVKPKNKRQNSFTVSKAKPSKLSKNSQENIQNKENERFTNSKKTSENNANKVKESDSESGSGENEKDVEDEKKTIKDLFQMNEAVESGDSEEGEQGSVSGEDHENNATKTNNMTTTKTENYKSIQETFNKIGKQIHKQNSFVKDLQLSIPSKDYKNLTEVAKDDKTIILAVPVKLTDKKMIEEQAEAIKQKLLGMSETNRDQNEALDRSKESLNANLAAVAPKSPSSDFILPDATLGATKGSSESHNPDSNLHKDSNEAHLDAISKNPVSFVLDQLKSHTHKIHNEFQKQNKGFKEILEKLKQEESVGKLFGDSQEKEDNSDDTPLSPKEEPILATTDESQEKEDDFNDTLLSLPKGEGSQYESLSHQNNIPGNSQDGDVSEDNEISFQLKEESASAPKKVRHKKGKKEAKHTKQSSNHLQDNKNKHKTKAVDSGYFASLKFQPSRVPSTFHNKVGDKHKLLLADGTTCNSSCMEACTPLCRFECCKVDKKSKALPKLKKKAANKTKEATKLKANKPQENKTIYKKVKDVPTKKTKDKLKLGTKQGKKFLRDTQAKLESLITRLEKSTEKLVTDDGDDGNTTSEKNFITGESRSVPTVVNDSCSAKCKIECLPSCRFECCKHENE